MQAIVTGTRVRSTFPRVSFGTVYAIDGAQMPGNVVQLFGGVGTTGGNARFDVVFDDGHLSLGVHESTIRGARWKILDEVVDAEAISMSLAKAEKAQAERNLAVIDAAQARAIRIQTLKTSSEYSKLNQGDCYSGKLAAQNIRAELKAAFTGVKFSVRKNDHGSLSIRWEDGPLTTAVDAVVAKYTAGHFDGMSDCYIDNGSEWCEVFGGARYISTHRDLSDALIQQAIDTAFTLHADALSQIARPSVEQYNAGSLLWQDVTLASGESTTLSRLILAMAVVNDGKDAA